MKSMPLMILASALGATLAVADTSSDAVRKLWVVLAAGSDSWLNYRHQADVCHAYQIVKAHGVPDENIIVFMRDDIAYNRYNPTPGVIINRPNGTNVYSGIPKDYVKDELKPELFLSALSGMSTGMGRKVVKSGPNDNIFVYFSDHGGPGLSEFGDSSLKATDLIRTIDVMHLNKLFNKMVLYWESCESGSMFQHLAKNASVFATSASSPSESSFACYLNDELETFLGDCYSVHWMENADQVDLREESLMKQFQITRKETTMSHVMEWGDKSMEKLKVADFLGTASSTNPFIVYNPSKEDTPVPAHEVSKYLLERRLLSSNLQHDFDDNLAKLTNLNQKRSMMVLLVSDILDNALHSFAQHRFATVTASELPANAKGLSMDILDNCYYKITDLFSARCYKFGCNNYLTMVLVNFATWCEKGYPAWPVMDAIKRQCYVARCGVH